MGNWTKKKVIDHKNNWRNTFQIIEIYSKYMYPSFVDAVLVHEFTNILGHNSLKRFQANEPQFSNFQFRPAFSFTMLNKCIFGNQI
jgi:hypothetical protein